MDFKKKKKRGNEWDEDPFDMFSRIDEIMEELMKNAFRGFDEKPFVYGFSMKTGPDGKPIINEFGNIKPGKGPAPDEWEPLVDVIEQDDKILVIVELPGVLKEDIRAEAMEQSITIAVDNEKRNFHKTISLPSAVNPDKIDAKYNNGVLEITLEKKEKSKKKKVSIQ